MSNLKRCFQNDAVQSTKIRIFFLIYHTHSIPLHQIHPHSRPQGHTASRSPHRPWCSCSGNACHGDTRPSAEEWSSSWTWCRRWRRCRRTRLRWSWPERRWRAAWCVPAAPWPVSTGFPARTGPSKSGCGWRVHSLEGTCLCHPQICQCCNA